jgi:hypothetical protein
MFSFFDMMNNYDDRKVGRYDDGDLSISTARVTDSDWDYETAVSHPNYNDRDWVIVECYETREGAKVGHDKWVETMCEQLPESLVDVSQAGVAILADVVAGDDWRIRSNSDFIEDNE